MGSRLILVTGGARSGKSAFAARLASGPGGDVLFIATARADDAEMERRIQSHQNSRPAHWRTLEVPRGVGEAITASIRGGEVVLVDCLGVLISNVLMDLVGDDLDSCQEQFDLAEREVDHEIESLLDAFQRSKGDFVVVTNEVGCGLVPPYPLGRAFRDLVGRANQSLASRADEVYLLVAGIPVAVKKLSTISLRQSAVRDVSTLREDSTDDSD